MSALGKPKPIRDPYTLNGFWVGTVVDNADPELAGRVQVCVSGIHTTGATGLPWAVPVQALMGTTSYGVPDIYQIVWIFFVNGDRSMPAYLGRLPEAAYDVSEGLFGFTVADTDFGGNVEIIVDRKDKEIRIGSVAGYTIKLGSTDLTSLVKSTVDVAVNTHKHRVVGVQNGGGAKVTTTPIDTVVKPKHMTDELEAG